mgnify:FL=1
MKIKENISKTLIDNKEIPKIHNLLVSLGFDLAKLKYVKYVSHENLISTDSTPNLQTRDILNHFSSRNAPFRKGNETKWKKIYNTFLKENKRNNLAMFQHKKSKMLLIDIDCHGNPTTEENLKLTTLNLIEELRTVFNCPDFSPSLIEISKRKRGIHMYIPINEIFSDEKTQFFLKKFKLYFEENNKGMIFEWRTTRKAVRLPFVVDYSIYRFENDKLVRTSFSNLHKVTPNPLNIDNVNRVLEEIYGRDKLVVFEREFSFIGETDFHDFSMYRGQRVDKHLALARFSHNRNTTYNEFEELSKKWNCGSKDLTYHLTKTCKSVWNSTKEYRTDKTSITISDFISNTDRLSSTKDNFIKKTISSNNYRFSHSNQSRLKDELVIFSRELFGYIEFQKEKPRRIRKGIRLTKSKKEKMLVGFQFPLLLQERIISHYGLQSSQRNLFKQFCNLFLVQFKHNERGWSEGCCRQYIERKVWKKSISNYYTEGFVTLTPLFFSSSLKKILNNFNSQSLFLYGHHDYGHS